MIIIIYVKLLIISRKLTFLVIQRHFSPKILYLQKKIQFDYIPSVEMKRFWRVNEILIFLFVVVQLHSTNDRQITLTPTHKYLFLRIPLTRMCLFLL